MGDRVVVPGSRDGRGILDGEGGARVAAAPPHPQHDGRRTDRRLGAVSDALTRHRIACMRFVYGPWDEGCGERRDVANAIAWVRERYDRVGQVPACLVPRRTLARVAGLDVGGDPPLR